MLISQISPFDELEKNHQADALAWLNTGDEIFRLKKPDIPPKHLVSYFVLVDQNSRKLLLIHHNKAKLWLAPGGHVEKDEHPKATVTREIQEELGVNAEFLLDDPFFITIGQTVNIDAGHTDVSLWFVLQADATIPLHYDEREMSEIKWFSFDEVLQSNIKAFNPEMHRFVRKLQMFLPTLIEKSNA